MPWDKKSVEELLLNRPGAKPQNERDEYDDLYRETRRRLAIERALRDDTSTIGKDRKLTTRNPHRSLAWKDV